MGGRIVSKTVLCPTLPPIAQLVEQLPLKEMVLGSNPSGRTRNTDQCLHCIIGLCRGSVQAHTVYARLGFENLVSKFADSLRLISTRYTDPVRIETRTRGPSGRTSTGGAYAGVVKLVYTPALGAGPFGGGGSSPLSSTTFRVRLFFENCRHLPVSEVQLLQHNNRIVSETTPHNKNHIRQKTLYIQGLLTS
jgi:hypothetical protein